MQTPQEIKHEDEKDLLFEMINRFIGYFTRNSQRESTNNEEAKYPFVPMDTRQMTEQIKLARNARVNPERQTKHRRSLI